MRKLMSQSPPQTVDLIFDQLIYTDAYNFDGRLSRDAIQIGGWPVTAVLMAMLAALQFGFEKKANRFAEADVRKRFPIVERLTVHARQSAAEPHFDDIIEYR